MTDSSLQAGEKAAAAVAQTPNRVTLEHLHDIVETVEYLRPESRSTLTIAVVTVRNGFCVTGESAAADPKNFNEELGQKFAYEDAIRKLWAMEGYLLRQTLYEEIRK